MGLPVEQWCGGGEAEKKEASGCRTPSSSKAQQQQQAAGCPEAPRKRRPAPGPVSQQRNGDYYTGADVEAFFAAHNL